MKDEVDKLCDQGQWSEAINLAKDLPDRLMFVGRAILDGNSFGPKRDCLLRATAIRLADLKEFTGAVSLLEPDKFSDQAVANVIRKGITDLFHQCQDSTS